MKRIEWIDSLKGFGIFCVTFGHLSCNLLLETHIYSFHMFLFFFISGFLHSNYNNNFKEYIIKKTKALLIPFLIWNLLSCLVGMMNKQTIVDSIRLFFLLDGSICWNAPIWFLLQLYMVETVYFFIEKYISKYKYACIPVLLMLWIFVSNNNIFLKLNIFPVCLLFYILGNVFKKNYDAYNEKCFVKPKYLVLVYLLLLCINIIFGIFLNKRITFTGADFGNVIYCALAAISGIIFYILLFQNIRILGTNKILSYLGKNSLIIMATQYYFFTVYDIISKKFLEISIWHYRSTIKAFVISVITILLICIIIQLLKKISNRHVGLKKICRLFGVNVS